ncbi:MAG: ornithine cyclodeaminase family protein [Castellaniella sp.]|uniref:ornithine cyclodeaminase family protein n=1 Tax=Castellaniella sp. TaxID=1955812 RepID=UPI0012201C9E|nr:ornithine cyclodeaminase family protein [Castellaniella sp.]TAN28505.1 MAG: ornithine cyclodeaminase family protein [Castellaniella sp.]
MKIVNATDAAEALPLPQLIDALQAGFVAGCHVPERQHHSISMTGEPNATLLTMPAWSIGTKEPSFLGVKLVTVFPGNTARDLPGLESVYVLFDGATGAVLAMIDGNTITARRTVSTAALAASFLSREDAHRLLVVGAGHVGSLLPEAYCAVRPIDEILVWDIRHAAAEALVDRLTGAGMNARVAEDLEQAVRHADIISTATLSTEPLVRGDWVRPGTHVDLIGSFTPLMRESDDALIVRASVYVDIPTAIRSAGDLLFPVKLGLFTAQNVRGMLAGLCRAGARARDSDQEITVFKTVGSALADLVAAEMAYKRLLEA